jgi:hypothetical protein
VEQRIILCFSLVSLAWVFTHLLASPLPRFNSIIIIYDQDWPEPCMYFFSFIANFQYSYSLRFYTAYLYTRIRRQECVTFGRHVQNQESSRPELSIGICMGPIRGGGGVVSPPKGSEFFWGGLQLFLKHFLRIINI